MSTLPRMLTLNEAADETGLCYSALRKLCLSGEIVHIRTGKKYLVNADKLAEYLNGER